MSQSFYDHLVFTGSHREVGRQYGEALREKILGHLEIIYRNAYKVSGVTKEKALQIAQMYEPYIEKYAPHYLDEIAGLGEGAGITKAEALLLQVRQEVVNLARFGGIDPECTAFAVTSEYTANGKVYSGQNSDMYDDFRSITNVITFCVMGKPQIMMAVPAGQLSFLGMNSEGISCNCNMLHCTGWKKGFPRYLMSRLILEQRTFEEACAKAEIPERASQRNILICDREGHIANYETTSTDLARIDGKGYLVHTNHFLAPSMFQYEKSNNIETQNSTTRYRRMCQLIEENKGKIDDLKLHHFLGDHGTEPDTICMHETAERGYHTFVSIINNLTDNVMEVAAGNPCCNEYAIYEFR